MEDQLELLAYTASMPNFRDPQPELPVYTAVDTIPSTTEPQAELPAYTAEANVPSITEPQPVHMTETQPHQFPDSRIEEVQSARTDDNKKPGTESLTEGEGEIETIIQIDENVSSLTDPQPEMPTQAHTAPGSRSGGSRTRTQTQARSPRTNQQRGSRRRQSRTRLRARCTEACKLCCGVLLMLVLWSLVVTCFWAAAWMLSL
ncbi:hypothetical protein BO78DRAFT_239244 [Aspergillus sclerotiicarbonarius CBS 121057]|uniref:Uncharacterized protein n=1 Tax=Aspergillus sclerotiicarbonarius (strain CBS 121057 / IBT 28362) TaxID=1448318 RepID=A0A319DW41_ASPSB|nr:hypothetical protein BO78DRAFT_239244 [Aspergillus sclerotiicarbonarius CBS 121057]